MKIAILAPSSVPYERGGAENLFETLQAWINENTAHDCELIKHPSRERGFFDLLRTYRDFMGLDLDHFDLVIATKYPSWMIRHDNLVVYMLHKLRGLYDTYHFNRLPEEIVSPPDFAKAQIASLEAACLEGDFTHTRALDIIDAFLALEVGYRDEPVFDFPGPLIRKLVHYLDNVGMAPPRVKRYLAIANTVKLRKNYFPDDVAVDVRYPPSVADEFYCRAQNHIFTASRLDGAKRIGLLVEAMRRTAQYDIPLLIAGDGPDRAKIIALADGDPRIRFLGRISDEAMRNYYADSLFVPFIPYDEDYGLITIEAMLSQKPVLTCTDSGGVNEFVEHDVSGLSVAPDVDAIAGAIEQLCGDRAATRAMGQRAYAKVADISWANVVEGLLGELSPPGVNAAPQEPSMINGGARPHLLVATTFPIWPPQGGGQQRIFNVYSRLARVFDVDIVTLGSAGATASQKEISPGFFETSIPPSQAHQEAELALAATINYAVPISDIAATTLWTATPDFAEAVSTLGQDVFAAVSSHPYFAPMLRKTLPRAPLWSESHNAEYRMKCDLLPETAEAEALRQTVFHAEHLSWHEATRNMACAEADLRALEQDYGTTHAPQHLVPNGVSLQDTQFVSRETRAKAKAHLGLSDSKIVLFMGSWHSPNLEAITTILEMAPRMPETIFHIFGSGCLAFNGHSVPPNVHFFSLVDETTKAWLIASADIALNPMQNGSGTNLKMFDYMAAGLPVLTTAFGKRGLNDGDGNICMTADTADFPEVIRDAFDNPDILADYAAAARKHVETYFDWDVIVDNYLQEIGIGVKR